MERVRRSLLLGLALSFAVIAAIVLAARVLRQEPLDVGLDAPSIASPRMVKDAAGDVITDAPRSGDVATSARAPSVVDASALGVPSGPGSIDVRVLRAEDHASLEDAFVEISLLGNSAMKASAKTDADGRARFTDLATGSWNVDVSAEERTKDRATARIRDKERNARVEMRLAFERTVAVHLADTSGARLALGSPVIGEKHWHEVAVVVGSACGTPGTAFDAGDAPRSRSTRYEELDGSVCWRVTIEGRDPACVHVVLRDTILAAETLDLLAKEVTLRIPRSAVAAALTETVVRVIDAGTALPVAGARVVLGRASGRWFERTTGEDGRASFDERIDPGSTVTVTAAGFATTTEPWSRTEHGVSFVQLVAGRRIEGVILRADGAPLRNAPLELRALAPNGRDVVRKTLMSLKSTNEGRFVFDGLAAGVYIVGHAASGVRWPMETEGRPAGFERVDCRAGDFTDLVLREIRVPWSERNSGAPSTYRRHQRH